MKSSRAFIQECINNYNVESVEQLPDFIQSKFASILLAENEQLANEVTGADNALWQPKMLPVLIKYLSNSTDTDEAIEFKNTWREGVTSYCLPTMQQLFEEEISCLK